VLCFPDQHLDAVQLRDFSARFGHIQRSVTGKLHDPLVPEVGILSNIIENGQPIGSAMPAGLHTDMSYNDTVGFVNVLYAVKVPMRDGRALAPRCPQHQAAYEISPGAERAAQEHDCDPRFQQVLGEDAHSPGAYARRSPKRRRKSRPPSVHPIFLTHPITGRTVLYCNPGYATRINELDEAASDRVLEQLFAHQLQEKYIYTHTWKVNDLLIWDHIGTLHMPLPIMARMSTG